LVVFLDGNAPNVGVLRFALSLDKLSLRLIKRIAFLAAYDVAQVGRGQTEDLICDSSLWT
jgi:hypothetical protein